MALLSNTGSHNYFELCKFQRQETSKNGKWGWALTQLHKPYLTSAINNYKILNIRVVCLFFIVKSLQNARKLERQPYRALAYDNLKKMK